MRLIHRKLWQGGVAALLLLACGLSGCALYREDKCWTPPEQYQIARELFIQTGSLDLVRERLKDLQWRNCRINESIYRLQKEFEVLPEELPRSSAVNPLATATPAPSAH